MTPNNPDPKPRSWREFFEEGTRPTEDFMSDPIGNMDLLIAAHALSATYTLVTNNLREFRRVSGLECENWN